MVYDRIPLAYRTSSAYTPPLRAVDETFKSSTNSGLFVGTTVVVLHPFVTRRTWLREPAYGLAQRARRDTESADLRAAIYPASKPMSLQAIGRLLFDLQF